MLAFTPLIVWNTNSVFFPYVTTKNIFMRAFLVLTSILFIIYFFYAKEFREEIIQKVNKFIKHPLVISIFAFIFILIISTIFAVDKYSAFWGNIERAEGLVGIIYFFAFFVFSLLVFEKKDWLLFFKLSLFTSFVLLFREFWQFLSGVVRPGSLADNPTFLAGYLLFSIACSLIVFNDGVPLETTRARSGGSSLMGWKIFSIIILILSVLGIFIAETRGTILGLAVGIVAILIYGIFKGKEINFWKFNLRKISIIILCFLAIFSLIFISTRKNEIWQKVPGFSRVSVVSEGDATTATRLLLEKLSMQAVNPTQNGFSKFLVGWGPENFGLAYGKYINPRQFNYETSWFDRAHNELLDRLVMNGVLGLIAYLAIWFFFFKSIFKKREIILPLNSYEKNKQASLPQEQFSLLHVGLLFFGISFLVHLLFIFDQITTSIPFFAVLSFATYLAIYGDTTDKVIKKQRNSDIEHPKIGQSMSVFVGIFFSILTIFLCFVFFTNDSPGYIQTKEYFSMRKTSNAEILVNKVNTVFEPFTSAQMNIRDDFLLIAVRNYNSNNEYLAKIFSLALLEAEDYTNKVPSDLQFLNNLAYVYMSEGNNLNNTEFLNKAEIDYKKLIFFAPNIPSYEYGYAFDLYFLKKYDESFNYFEKTFDADPSLYLQDGKNIEGIYTIFLQYFYQNKDKIDFQKTIERLKENGYNNQAVLGQVIK
jgi:O-antigen ligase